MPYSYIAGPGRLVKVYLYKYDRSFWSVYDLTELVDAPDQVLYTYDLYITGKTHFGVFSAG